MRFPLYNVKQIISTYQPQGGSLKNCQCLHSPEALAFPCQLLSLTSVTPDLVADFWGWEISHWSCGCWGNALMAQIHTKETTQVAWWVEIQDRDSQSALSHCVPRHTARILISKWGNRGGLREMNLAVTESPVQHCPRAKLFLLKLLKDRG